MLRCCWNNFSAFRKVSDSHRKTNALTPQYFRFCSNIIIPPSMYFNCSIPLIRWTWSLYPFFLRLSDDWGYTHSSQDSTHWHYGSAADLTLSLRQRGLFTFIKKMRISLKTGTFQDFWQNNRISWRYATFQERFILQKEISPMKVTKGYRGFPLSDSNRWLRASTE